MIRQTMKNKKEENFFPTGKNYNISLDEIKRLNFWNFLLSLGGELKKKKKQ